jgi:L-glyceraldehyde 3-phosphate reductase
MDTWTAAPDRYDRMPYRRCGRSGLLLPAISLGFWHNFGAEKPADLTRAMTLRAFDLGITHFDLANNYGVPAGSAEQRLGEVLAGDLAQHRDELVIATKAGFRMQPGPYGEFGSRKTLLNSLDASLRRLRTEYVDILYSHRPDPDTPLEETMGALAAAVQQGKALYVGVSSYSPEATDRAAQILAGLGVPALVHQPVYSMFNRWIEHGLTDVLHRHGMGSVAFSPLAQGLLTDKYLHGIPADSRAGSDNPFLAPEQVQDRLAQVRALHEVAAARGQSLAQLALAWVLRTATSVIIGASRVEQIEDNVAAVDHLGFSDDELWRIGEILG